MQQNPRQRLRPLPASDIDEEEPRRKQMRKGQPCCSAKAMHIATLVPVWIIAILLGVVVGSVYSPYGKANQMIDNAYIMLNQVVQSGVADVVYDMGTTWQATNQTQNIISMMNGANAASVILFDVVAGIEPELIADLMNRTTITVSNLLELVDSIVTQKGLNFNIPLGGMARRRLL